MARAKSRMRPFRGPDGTMWGVEVKLPGASNAMIVFHHPARKTARLDRYAWHAWKGSEARSVTSRVPAEKVLERLTDDEIALLFRRSMPISAGRSPLEAPEVAYVRGRGPR